MQTKFISITCVSAITLALCLSAGCGGSLWPYQNKNNTDSDQPVQKNEAPALPLPAKILSDTKETPAPAPLSEPTGPLQLDVQEAVLLALEKNISFQIERLTPKITETEERQKRAAFDPSLSAEISLSGTKTKEVAHDNSVDNLNRSDSLDGSLTLQEFFPTGTTVEVSASRSLPETKTATKDTKSHSTEYDVMVTQSLLRGFGLSVNLASLRQARLDTQISEYELRGIAEALIADVETSYWDCVLAKRSIEIYEKSLKIAEQQIEEATERIRIGNMAETELAAYESELASRREDLIDARGQFAKNRLQLLRLVNPRAKNPWQVELDLTANPSIEAFAPLADIDAHVAVGRKQRSDLNQAKLSLKKGEIEIVRTRNGLLPKLDLFVRLGGTRYAEAFSTASDQEGRDRTLSAGISLDYTLGNRAERATHDRACFSLEQMRASLQNMEQLVQVDIRTAYIELQRSREQGKATTATRKLREETLRTEREKFRVGKSTSILVAQAWRDLVESQISEISAVIEQRKALLDLYLQEGSLLERHGIQAP